MPVYIANPKDSSPLRTRLIERDRYLRSGVVSMELRQQDERGLTFNTTAERRFRKGMASEEEMLQMRADGSVTEAGTLRLDVVAPGVFRVRYALGDAVPDVRTPMLLDGFEQAVAWELRQPAGEGEGQAQMQIVTADHVLSVNTARYELTITDATGRHRFRAGGAERNYFNAWDAHSLGHCLSDDQTQRVSVECFGLKMDEGVYGFGEHFVGLNKVGQTIDLNNCDAIGTMTPRMYKSVPFYLSTRNYGVYVNQPARMTFWVGSRITSDVQLAVDDDYLDYFIVLGGDMKDVLGRYTALTGRAPVPPKWSFGLWMSKITYTSQDEVMQVAKDLRQHRLPCDVIHLDTGWFATNWVCDLEFSKDRFPDPKGMMEQLRRMGFRVSLWQQPYVRQASSIFQEGIERDVFVRNIDGKLTPHSERGVIDYSNPAAIEWVRAKFARLFEMGAAAIKTDFGETIPDDGIYHDGTPGHRMHNLYSLLYNRAVFDITRECTGEGLVWARSGTAGSQRYPLHWGGDNSPNYDNIQPSLCGGLNLGLCGFSFWSQDIGGFMGEPTPELYVRWLQVGMFGSHARIHGRFDREPYRFGDEVEQICREFLNLRSRLMPYIYSIAHHSAAAGLPVMRPLVLEFQDDPMVHNLSHEFMFGPSLLVAPVLDEACVRRDVYLPGGDWYDWWSGQRIKGGRWISAEIPLDRIGLYVRAGSMIPLGPVNQYVDEHPPGQLELHVYPGEHDVSFTLVDGGSTTFRFDRSRRRVLAEGRPVEYSAVIH